MKIVIDITPEAMDDIKNGRASRYFLENKILNGKLLPKGHGDLIDREALRSKLQLWDHNVNAIPNYAWAAIDNAPAVIEADEGEEE